MKLEDIRREYLQNGLRRNMLQDDPHTQFELWLSQAIESKIADPTAMTLATVNAEGVPSQRIVLLKHSDDKGLVFFTNYGSAKAKDIADNPNVSMHFPWHMMERQITITGQAEKISTAESLAYFMSRPRDSQLAAWASSQSHKISSRQFLLAQYESMKQKFKQGRVPLPDFWGGFRIVPTRFEFWQGGGMRLHDRFEYCLQNDQSWSIVRLAP